MMLFHDFKHDFTFEQRCIESNRVLQKFTDRVPIICERSKSAASDCPLIDKKKYLVPRDLTLGQYLYVIRKRLKLRQEKAIFLFINNRIISSTQLIGEIYEKNKHSDGFLYVSYSFENVFG
jgi:GABA(A) receptor-associated protein